MLTVLKVPRVRTVLVLAVLGVPVVLNVPAVLRVPLAAQEADLRQVAPLAGGVAERDQTKKRQRKIENVDHEPRCPAITPGSVSARVEVIPCRTILGSHEPSP